MLLSTIAFVFLQIIQSERDKQKLRIHSSDVSKLEKFNSLLHKVGLFQYYPKKLSIRDSVEIREDTLNIKDAPIDSTLYPFLVLQKIMAFDSEFRIPFKEFCKFGVNSQDRSNSGSEDTLNSESDENEDSVHPMDSLLALIHCCDNFLRQELFCRMAACQIALPILLPDPITGELTMLLWAMRAIVKEFVLPDGKACCGRITDIAMPFVSFLRVGCHSISKSETINYVISGTDQGIENQPFFGYMSPGGEYNKCLVNGLVEISWYIPGDGLFPMPLAFLNLRGDGSDPKLNVQVDFLCSVSAVNVLLLSSDVFEDDCTREGAIGVLNKLSSAQGMPIILQTRRETKAFNKTLSEAIGESLFLSKFEVLKHEKKEGILREKLKHKLETISSRISTQGNMLSVIAYKSKVTIDEHDVNCAKGKELAEEICSVLNDFTGRDRPNLSPENMLLDKSPKHLLPLQSPELWQTWAALEKEQYCQRHKHGARDLPLPIVLYTEGSTQEYGEKQRKHMRRIREVQYAKVKEQGHERKAELMPLFINTLRISDSVVLWYFLKWLKIALEDLSFSQLIFPSLHVNLRKFRTELSNMVRSEDKEAFTQCLHEMQEFDKKMITASFGVEHLMREVGQMYEAVAEYEDVSHPDCSVRDLPQIAAQMLCDGFPLELLDGEASHMPRKWVSAVLHCLAKLIKRDDCDPGVYVLSILGYRSTEKSMLLSTLFGTQFSVIAGRYTRGTFMKLIPVHPSLHDKTSVEYFILIDSEGLRAPEVEYFEHNSELATVVTGIANWTLICSDETDKVMLPLFSAFFKMEKRDVKQCCHVVHHNILRYLNKVDEAQAVSRVSVPQNSYCNILNSFGWEIKGFSELPEACSGDLPMAQVSSGYSKRAQQLKFDLLNECRKSRNCVPVFRVHLHKLWNAVLQQNVVSNLQNTFEVVTLHTLELKVSNFACKFIADMNVLQQAAGNELYGCKPTELDETLKKHMKLLEKSALECLKKYKQEILDLIIEDDIMLKWKSDMEMKLEHLHDELESTAKHSSILAYQAKKDCSEAEREKQAINIMIQGKVIDLAKAIGMETLSEEEMARFFNQAWSDWIEGTKLDPFIMPNIPYIVEKCLRKFFPELWKGILLHEYSGEFEIKVKHIKQTTSMFQSMLALFWKGPQNSPYILQKVQRQTNEIFAEVEDYLKFIKASNCNFSSQLVKDLLQIVHKGRLIEKEDFEFTDAYEFDVAISVCHKAIPVFEDLVENFRRRHDPNVYIDEEMKPNFRCMLTDMVNNVECEQIAANRLCSQLREPIKKCVLHNLPSVIFKEMTTNYVWSKHKQTFIGKILLEIGEQLNRGGRCELCTDFLVNPSASLEYWAKYFTEQHCHSGTPSHITEVAKSELNEAINFLIEKAESTSHALSQLEKINVLEWVKHFHSTIIAKVKVTLTDLNMYLHNHELLQLKIFTDKVKYELEKFRSVLCQNITYSQTADRVSTHEMILKVVSGCSTPCPFCGAQCELTTGCHTSGVPHSTQHRPLVLGRYQYGRGVFDACTYLVATDSKYKNESTKGKYQHYKKYHELYPDWLIPADKSFEASLYWKWFIGQYSTTIRDCFHIAESDIPEEWKALQWRTVKEWLITEYNLQ